MIVRSLGRAAALCGLALVSAAHADGSGTLNDAGLSLSYTTPSMIMANQVGYNTGQHACEEGTPLCDVYTLTVDLSEGFRNDEANAGAYIDVLLDSAGDFDLYVYDSAGTQIAASENTGAEALAFDFDQLPNGTYKLWLIPYEAVDATADLTIAVTGAASKNGVLGVGSLGLMLLLSLAGIGALRRR